MADPRMAYSPEDVREAWSDPRFHELPEDNRLQIMGDMDPTFAQMAGIDKRRVLKRMYDRFAPKAPAAPVRPETENMAATALAQSGLTPAAPPDMGRVRVQPQEAGIMEALTPRTNPFRKLTPPLMPFQPPAPQQTAQPQAAPPQPQLPPVKPNGTPLAIARSGPHVTLLSPVEEQEFRSWVQQNNVPFDPGPQAGYDMRGFWRAQKRRDPRAVTEGKDDGLHFPDIWKTPYHATFSNESIYAGPDAPKWVGSKLVDATGQFIKDEDAEKAAAKEAQRQEKEQQWVRDNLAKQQQQSEKAKERDVKTLTGAVDRLKPVPGMEKLGGAPPGVPAPPLPAVNEVDAPGLAMDVARGLGRGAISATTAIPSALSRIPGGLRDDLTALREPSGGEILSPEGAALRDARERFETERRIANYNEALLPTAPVTVPGKFAEALGSTAPYMAAGAIGGLPATAAMGILQGSEESMARADRSKLPLSDMQRLGVAATGAAIGSTEALPFVSLLRKMRKAGVIAEGADLNRVAAELFPSVKDYIKSAGLQALEEGGQEAFTGIAQDALEASYGGRKTGDIGKDALQEFTMGGGVGAMLDTLTKFAGSRGGRARMRELGVDPNIFKTWAEMDPQAKADVERHRAIAAAMPEWNAESVARWAEETPEKLQERAATQSAEIDGNVFLSDDERVKAHRENEKQLEIATALMTEANKRLSAAQGPPADIQPVPGVAEPGINDLEADIVPVASAQLSGQMSAPAQVEAAPPIPPPIPPYASPTDASTVDTLSTIEGAPTPPPSRNPLRKKPAPAPTIEDIPPDIEQLLAEEEQPGINEIESGSSSFSTSNEAAPTSQESLPVAPPDQPVSVADELPPNWQSAELVSARYPAARSEVDGRKVRSSTPNIGSIESSFNEGEYEELPGIREVQLSDFEQPPSVNERTSQLAEEIRESGEINPLIVAIDEQGPYILEGAHRYDALKILGAKSFPAVVVVDTKKAAARPAAPSTNPAELTQAAPEPREEVVQQAESPAPAGEAKPRNPFKKKAAPQVAAKAPIIETEKNNDVAQPGVRAEDALTTRGSDSEALASTPTEDDQGAGREWAVPEERLGGTGIDQRPSLRTDGGEETRAGSSEGDSNAGVGAASDGGRPADDRIRADVSDRPSTGRDHRIGDDDGVGTGGPRERVRYNLEAIRLLKKIETEGRDATPDEMRQLARYVGWGGMPQAFDPYNRDWRGAHEELKGELTPEEFSMARASTPNAHYTSKEVVRGIWSALEKMGLKPNASVLEPSVGVGNFFGLQPDSLLPSRRTGIELDSLTGRIAKALYPDASIHVAGFEKVRLPNNHFDVAIGNVPFGDYGVHDPEFRSKPALTSRIHDYFFAKALNKVRPGGVVAFITSHHSMDKVNSSIRGHLAKSADLIGAIRLPSTAFKGSAGTEVTTDIIFLQKRAPGQATGGESWTGLQKIQGKDGAEIDVNEYFARHPEMMLGEMALEGRMYAGKTPTLVGQFTPEALAAAIEQLPKGIISEAESTKRAERAGAHISTIPEAGQIKDGGYGIVKDQLVKRGGDEIVPYRPAARIALKIRGLISIRDAVRNVLRVQLDDKPDADLKQTQKHLNAVYDAFVKEHGPISDKANIRPFSEDPDAPLLLSLELYDPDTKVAKKTPVFTERTLAKYVPVERAETAAEAMAVSLNEYGRLDLSRMQELTGKSPDDLRAELGSMVFQNPDGRKWEPADEYLSGDVRKKLRDAESAAKADKQFASNVEALQKVQPIDLEPAEIDARLGASWIPKEAIQRFAADVLRVHVSIGHAGAIGAWTVSPNRQSNLGSVENMQEYGTSRIRGHELLENAMNHGVPKVFDKIDDKSVLNQAETILAQEKLQNLKDRFKSWVWEDQARATILAKKYNEEFNNLRLRSYDGAHLTFPGITNIELRPHQKNGAWRVLQSGNTLLAHVVGAGKTFTMAAAAMELRRIGLAKKPMFVVPNHLVEQWGAEFLRLYPSANIFVAGKDFFQKGKRQQAMSRIATGNFDAIIVSHKSFEKLPVADSTFEDYMQSQVDELIEAIEEMRQAEGGKGKTVKQLEKAKKNLEAKMENRANREARDNTITFEELGVDQIFVDEAHMYKNLFFVTKMGRVAGLPQSESQRAFDMYIKTQYLTQKNGGRGVVFATGTPVANSMAELFTMQRYLQAQYLKDNGIQAFDAWAANFGETVTGLELAPEGTGYRMNTRFSKFVNLPELMTGFRSVADVQTADMLDLPRPRLKTGKAQPVTAPETDEIKALVKTLGDRAAGIRTGRVDPKKDNMLKITTEGRKAALDLRVLDPSLPDHPDSKINRAVDKIHQIWQDTAKDRLTQLVFIDLSTPKKEGQAGFSAYNEMRRKLVALGIPAKEVAFIHDAETDADKMALFNSVNAGRVRILFGSTEKMGAGTNVQKRLVALHHMDAPWRPADIEQREGRILRQGNSNEEVEIFQYLTQGSFDAYMWQTLANKAGFISKVMTGELSVRSAEDVGQMVLSAEEMMGLSSGNPEIKEKVQVDAELRKLASLRTSHRSAQMSNGYEIARLPGEVQSNEARAEKYRQDAKTRDQNAGEMRIGKKVFTGDNARKEFTEALDKALRSWKDTREPQHIGSMSGFPIWTSLSATARLSTGDGLPDAELRGNMTYEGKFNVDNAAGVVQSLEYRLRNLETYAETAEGEAAKSEKKLKRLQEIVDEPFDKELRYQELLKRQAELAAKLKIGNAGANAAAAEEAAIPSGRTEQDGEEDEGDSPRSSEAGFMAPDLFTGIATGLIAKLRGNPTSKKADVDHFKWSSPDVETRFQDGGRPQDDAQGFVDWLKTANEALSQMWRTYKHLPREQYGRLYFEITKLKKAHDLASSKAMISLARQLATMDVADYELFRKAVIADDLMETVELFREQGKEIPEELAFGFTAETLPAEHARAMGAVAANEKVARAIEHRREAWEKIRVAYTGSMKDIGEDVGAKFQRKNYYRHEVLMEKRLDALANTADGPKNPNRRSFLNKRDIENIGRDYATNFVETEAKIMAQLMVDTQTANFIKFVGDEYDIVPELKKEAKLRNVEAVMPYFEMLAAEANKDRSPSSEAPPLTGADMFRRILNKDQAIAFQKLGELAAQGQLPDTDDGRWSSVIDEMAEDYLAARADGEEDAGSFSGGNNVLAYAAWLVKQKASGEGSAAAGQLFKGIRNKRNQIEAIAGDKFVTWKDLVPDTHTDYEMDPSQTFYRVFSIPERLALEVLEGSADQIGLKKEDIRKVFAMGAKPEPMYLPKPVVEQFKAMAAELEAKRTDKSVMRRAAQAVQNEWKRYQLHAIHRLAKYMIRNFTGDFDSMLSGLPWGKALKAFGKTKERAAEVKDYFKPILQGKIEDSRLSPELERYLEFGAFQNLLSVFETQDPVVPAILREFDAWEKHTADTPLFKKVAKAPLEGYKAYMRKAGILNDWREGTLRYLTYRIFLDDINANNGKPSSYSASVRQQIDQLPTAEEKAYQMSNDLMGAYDEISYAGQKIRRWGIPFWAFQELNARRQFRLIKNASGDGRIAAAAMPWAAKYPYMGYRVGKQIMKSYAFWALAIAFNMLSDDDDEKLPKDIRQRPHLTFGSTKDGNEIINFTRVGNMADLLEWFDIEEGKDQFQRAFSGRKPFGDAIMDWAKNGPMEKLLLSASPLWKYPIEFTTGTTWYPSIEKGRKIESWPQKIAQDFGFRGPFDRLTGRPAKDETLLEKAGDLFIYRTDGNESAYYDIQAAESQWRKQQGKEPSDFSSMSQKSIALRNVKRALRVKDQAAFNKYVSQYLALGGTEQSFNRSIGRLKPLAGLKEGERQEFIESLSAEDKRRLDLAFDYYNETFLGDTAQRYVNQYR